MNKKNIIDFVTEETGLTRKDAKAAIESTVKAIHMALVKGIKAQIADLGTFDLTRRQARTGRNPKTGEKIKIDSKTVVKFRPSKALKELVKDI